MKDATLDVLLQQFGESFYRNRYKYQNFAQRFVRNSAVVEDLINDSFINLWERRTELEPDCVVEAYFYTILKNNCLNWLRDQKSQGEIQNKLFDTSYRLLQYDISTLENYDPNFIFSNEIRDILQEQLAKMSPLVREIFKDNRFRDMTYEQIAAKYHISVWKVAREIQTAMRILRVSLGDYLPVFLAIVCG
ncbi:MAG: sigma-70 family RNA polymerase sigma factor, partial [Alistipes sp.]